MRLFITIVLLLFFHTVFAQEGRYHFSRLTINNGLSNNQVNAVYKSDDGFMWFGTMSGLNRYDGYTCKVFRRAAADSTSLLDNYIFSISGLPHAKMWVTTRGGPCVYDAGGEKFTARYEGYLQQLGLPAGTVHEVVKGNNGRYWFLYDSAGLYSYSEKSKKVTQLAGRVSSGAAAITAVKETKDSTLWLVYNNGLLQQRDILTGKIIRSAEALLNRNKKKDIYNMYVDEEGDVWVWNYSNGIFLYEQRTGNLIQFGEHAAGYTLSANLVSQVTQDDNGNIWVATDHGGVTLINKKQGYKTRFLLNDPKDLNSLSQNSINALYKDDNGIIWLGTYKQGINYLDQNVVQFPYYRHVEADKQSLPFEDVNRFVEDKNGNIWIGTNGGGLLLFNREKNTFQQFLHNPDNPNSLSNNVIVGLCMDYEGVLWIGTYFGGLNSFDGKRFTHYRHNDKDSTSLADDRVWEIYEDDAQRLWIGTLGGGLDLLNRKNKQFQHYRYAESLQSPVPLTYIAAIAQDHAGSLWIGSSAGITIYGKEKPAPLYYYNSTAKGSLSNNNVICFLPDSKGRMWVGTREGLNLFNEATQQFQVFTTADGLPDNTILNILEDEHHTFWISTPNGLCNAIPRQDGAAISFTIVAYDEMNGILNREFNDNAALKTASGELLFGGPAGFNFIEPAITRKPVKPSRLLFTELRILNRRVEVGEVINNRVLLEKSVAQLDGITLRYDEHVFSIGFAALDYAPGQRRKYAYKMEGFNQDWLYAGNDQRQATFTNLDPGRYTFRLKVLNGNGTWSDEKALQVTILPPFWRTPLALVLYMLVAAGLLLLVRKITLDRIHMRYEVRQQKKEAERAHAIEQLKTRFFTNVSHEFRTPLSLIISPLDKMIKQSGDEEQRKQLHLVQRNAKRLLNLVNQLLDFRKIEVQQMKLHLAIGDIVGFCRETSVAFMDVAEKKNIQFSFIANVEALEMYFDKDKVEKILFNLLSNAFKYSYDGGSVTLTVHYLSDTDEPQGGKVSIEVCDTGIGIPPDKQEQIFERFFQTDLPDSMVNQGTGIGLAITREFVKLHHGEIMVRSQPDKGSCFQVLLPAETLHQPTEKSAVVQVLQAEAEDALTEEPLKKGKKKTIVIVEDNEDLRFYLKDNLKTHYHIVEAVNGKDGWQKTRELMPDLVVSDIMMPLMDGVALAKLIKTDTLTAHIPVILLTAMGSEEKQLEGLRVGVNDYITKPFTFEILASRIANLLAQQVVLQKRFQKQIEVNPAEITVTPVDETFLKQVLETVEKQMDNPGFSVEELSRAVFMNRVTFYRKILSLTGKTPIEFIRSIRMKRAAQLLEKSGMTIAEIAWEVGFNNPKNFSKCFKEEFNLLPTQYAAAKKAGKS